MSSLIYRCESWVGADIKLISKLYNWCLKQLLGERRSTCNDVCYAESGYPPLGDFVKARLFFFRSMWQERSNHDDDPLGFVIRMVMDMNTMTGRSIRLFIDSNVTDLSEIRKNVLRDIRNSRSSRRETYMDIIPDGSLHYVYKVKHTINETHRTSFTRFRVSGHALACESGRWNRSGHGRLPLEERLCQCGAVQTERHVLQNCPLTRHIRDTYEFTNLD